MYLYTVVLNGERRETAVPVLPSAKRGTFISSPGLRGEAKDGVKNG
jgi:hypothetical protein